MRYVDLLQLLSDKSTEILQNLSSEFEDFTNFLGLFTSTLAIIATKSWLPLRAYRVHSEAIIFNRMISRVITHKTAGILLCENTFVLN